MDQPSASKVLAAVLLLAACVAAHLGAASAQYASSQVQTNAATASTAAAAAARRGRARLMARATSWAWPPPCSLSQRSFGPES
jgi:hypothetical protein